MTLVLGVLLFASKAVVSSTSSRTLALVGRRYSRERNRPDTAEHHPVRPARSRVVQGGQSTHPKTSCSCALVLAWLEECRLTIDSAISPPMRKRGGLEPTLTGRFVRCGGGGLVAVRPGADVPGDLGAHRWSSDGSTLLIHATSSQFRVGCLNTPRGRRSGHRGVDRFIRFAQRDHVFPDAGWRGRIEDTR